MSLAPAQLRAVLPELARLGRDGTALAGALERWLEGDDLDAALGLAPGWRQRDRLDRRDVLLRELGAWIGGTAHARAVAVRKVLLDYQASAWRYQRDLAELPPDAPGRHVLLHQICRLGDPPTSVRQLTSIMEVCNGEPLRLQTDLGDGCDHEPQDAAA